MPDTIFGVETDVAKHLLDKVGDVWNRLQIRRKAVQVQQLGIVNRAARATSMSDGCRSLP